MDVRERKGGWRNGLLLVASILVSIVALEVLLRVSGYNRPMFYAYDLHAGSALRSDLAGWVNTETTEFVRNDRYGFRIPKDAEDGRSVTKEKPAGTLRVALLGDSYTESHHVDFAESFPYLLQSNLQACDRIAKRVEVLNFAVSGYNNVQELMSFRHKAKDFAPDIVVLVFHPNNDLGGNYAKLEGNPFIPYAEFRDGVLKLDASFRDNETFLQKLTWSNFRNEISNRVRLLQLLTNAYGMWINRQGRTRSGREARPSGSEASPNAPISQQRPAASPDVDKYFSNEFSPAGLRPPAEHLPPRDAFEETLWRLAEAVVLRLHAEVAETGATFYLTSTATGVAIAPSNERRTAFMVQNGVSTVNYARDRLMKLAADNGFRFVSLVDDLRRVAESEGKELEYFEVTQAYGHWNARAHAVVASALANAICAGH